MTTSTAQQVHGMAYGLRKINKDGIHRGFQWPLEVGAVVTAPDWRPNNKCGGGLHFCTPNAADLDLLTGHYWAVIEYDETKAIDLKGKMKVETCKIVHLSETTEGLKEWFVGEETSQWAHWWVRYIGDRDYMRQFVTESKWAYLWALRTGDKDYMRQFVTEPEYAIYWALNIGDEDHMRQFIVNSESAYGWACLIGEWDLMRPLVTEPEWAYKWAMRFGDKDHMRQFVTESEWAYEWARRLGDHWYMQQFVTEPFYIDEWNRLFPKRKIPV